MVLLTVVTATPVHAADNGSWAVFPTPPAGTATPGPGDRQYFYLESAPGRVVSDRVSVVNLTDQPKSFRLYAADAYNTPRDGGFALRTVDQKMTGVGAWAKLNVSSLTVPPRTRADIPFTISIPSTAEPGDHPGAIVAVETSVEATTQQGGLAVGVKRAVGARIYLHVTGQSVPALSVDAVSVDRSAPLVPGFGASRGTLHYTLTNHGNVTLHPNVEVVETGWFGSVYHRPPTSSGIELLPGQSVQLTLALPAPPQFDDVSVTVKASDGSTTAQGRTDYLAVPWLVVAVVALLLAGLGVWLRLRAKGRRVHRAGWRRRREPAGVTA
ncbi:WxL protein peptidoglycan domain-containing protein [Streptacidiphilus sp. MAP12-33]|uniref:WxL protein peptidoglycan domain-containing protein n=1 Tax=Streptacidiphilus sp. MAP12-33 TaxID=3156266 RepID=UPI0035177EED